MNSIRLTEIITALNNKTVNEPCPRCSTNNFSIVGESEITVTEKQEATGIGLASINQIPRTSIMPTIIVTCDNCGYVSQHAQAALDLLPKNRGFSLSRMGSK